MSSDDFAYLRRRAAEERGLALKTSSAESRAMHLDLAEHCDRASGRLDDAEHMRSSREAVERSLRLLAQTALRAQDR